MAELLAPRRPALTRLTGGLRVRVVPYPVTYPEAARDDGVVDLAGRSCARLTGSGEIARRLARLDEEYIRSSFVPLDEIAASRPGGAAEVRALIAARRLPQPAYRLDDGTDMVPADFFALADDAGDLAALPELFKARYERAATHLGLALDDGDLDDQWAEYLSGVYGVCLHQATPENIAAKARCITTIDRLLARPCPESPSWCEELRAAVERLGAIERPGAILDPPRWGGPMSPQWYDAFVRVNYPQAFTPV